MKPNQSQRRAFEQEKGQFICHIYSSIEGDDIEDSLVKIIKVLRSQKSEATPNAAILAWNPLNETATDLVNLHLTLIQGHRALHYHQIKHLIELLRNECSTIKPFSIFLDHLEILSNHEKTKQFLCLATSNTATGDASSDLMCLRKSLKDILDRFATRLTEEDENINSITHCSFMVRDAILPYSNDQIKKELEDVYEIFGQTQEEFPICALTINRIHVTIGNHTYTFELSR